jgi:hypothetical protein
VIDPTYLSTLRRQIRCELVVTLVQLEQLCPGWWETLSDLAEQLGTDRASLNSSLVKLESLGLLRRSTISKSGGNWVWWVKRHENDRPRAADEPCWSLRDTQAGTTTYVPISRRYEWAADRGIARATMRGFLNGHRSTMQGRWRVVRSPWDEKEPAPCPANTKPSRESS